MLNRYISIFLSCILLLLNVSCGVKGSISDCYLGNESIPCGLANDILAYNSAIKKGVLKNIEKDYVREESLKSKETIIYQLPQSTGSIQTLSVLPLNKEKNTLRVSIVDNKTYQEKYLNSQPIAPTPQSKTEEEKQLASVGTIDDLNKNNASQNITTSSQNITLPNFTDIPKVNTYIGENNVQFKEITTPIKEPVYAIIENTSTTPQPVIVNFEEKKADQIYYSTYSNNDNSLNLLKQSAPLVSNNSNNSTQTASLYSYKTEPIPKPKGVLLTAKPIIPSTPILSGQTTTITNDYSFSKDIVFNDVPENEWYAPYIYMATNDNNFGKWIDGYYDNSFRPMQIVNRAEISKMIYFASSYARSKNKDTSKMIYFEDVNESNWFYPYVLDLYQKDIIQNNKDKFYPSNPVTMPEAAKIITRAFDPTYNNPSPCFGVSYLDNDLRNQWFSTYLEALISKGIIDYKNGKNGVDLTRGLTRAEVTKMILLARMFWEKYSTDFIDSKVFLGDCICTKPIFIYDGDIDEDDVENDPSQEYSIIDTLVDTGGSFIYILAGGEEVNTLLRHDTNLLDKTIAFALLLPTPTKAVKGVKVGKVVEKGIVKLTIKRITANRLLGKCGEKKLLELFAGGTNYTQRYLSTSAGGRFLDFVTGKIGYEAKTGFMNYTGNIVKQVAKDAELLKTKKLDEITWVFFKSPVTGEIGASSSLIKALENADILYDIKDSISLNCK